MPRGIGVKSVTFANDMDILNKITQSVPICHHENSTKKCRQDNNADDDFDCSSSVHSQLLAKNDNGSRGPFIDTMMTYYNLVK